MRDILKYVGLFLVGLIVAIIIYPFLHEAGHSVMAILVGAKVINFNLFPLPYVICEVSNLNPISMSIMGLGGMFIPALISFIARPNFFWFWYSNLVMKLICLLSFVISLIALMLHSFGVTIKNEDIIQVVNVWNNGVFILIIALVMSMVVIIRSIIKQKPLIRIMDYFKVKI